MSLDHLGTLATESRICQKMTSLSLIKFYSKVLTSSYIHDIYTGRWFLVVDSTLCRIFQRKPFLLYCIGHAILGLLFFDDSIEKEPWRSLTKLSFMYIGVAKEKISWIICKVHITVLPQAVYKCGYILRTFVLYTINSIRIRFSYRL